MMLRVNATPALTRISSSALQQMVIPETATAPVNAPLEGLHRGSLFWDRTDKNLLWYVPVYSIAVDPDPAFAFSATQTGHDDKGNPFFAGRLTFSITKSIPTDVPGFKAQFPNARVQEIPVEGLTASLTTSYKEASGNDQFRTLEGAVATGSGGNLRLTFDILAGAVVSLYEDLIMFGGASVVLVPEGKQASQMRDFRFSLSDKSGRFTLRSVPPGDYKLYAFEQLDREALMDPEFRRLYEDQGHTVRVGADGQSDVTLEAIAAN